MMTLYGTPQTVALNQRLEQDKMPTTSPGFGIAAAADGTRYPYLFPIAATYWSQAAAAVKFAKDKLGGSLKGKKIAYVYYDNPAGKEPMPIIDALQKSEGFELRTFAVPPPGVEMGAQILDITQRYPSRFRDRPPVRALALGDDQGAEGRRLPAVEGASGWCGPRPRPTSWRPAAGVSPRATTRCNSPAPATTTRCASRSRRCTRRKARTRPRRWTTRSSTTAACCRRRSRSRRSRTRCKISGGQKPTGDAGQGGPRADPRLHPGRPGPAVADHPDRPRRRRLGADLPGPRRQVRQGDRLVPRLSRCRRKCGQDRRIAAVASDLHRGSDRCSPSTPRKRGSGQAAVSTPGEPNLRSRFRGSVEGGAKTFRPPDAGAQQHRGRL